MKVLFEARKAVFLAALFSGVVAQGAHAATLISPYVIGSFACIITNIGTKDITAKIELLDVNGTVALEDELLVLAGRTRDVSFGPSQGYCRFSGDFSKKKVRANVTKISGGHTTVVAPAE